jgi:hypothetical protein
MIDDRKLPAVVRDQVAKFGARMAKGLTKPLTKFVAQMIFGILAAKDIKLSNIARGLQEEIPLAKTEERLSRNNRTSKIAESVMQALVEDGAPWIKADTVLAIDISDVAKEYAEKMEYLATVRDGSKQGELVQGYWLLGVVGADVKGERLTPLLMNLYSQKADDFESENTQILTAIDQIKSVVGNRGIWAIDRGGDRRHLLDGLLERSCQFVVRLTGARNLKDARGKMQNSLVMAKAMHCSETIEIEVEEQGERKHRRVQLGCKRVKLPKRDEWLMLVVIKGFGEKPMLLLTTVTNQSPHGILEIYLTRWKIEESYRFLKSSYHIEDIRVRSYVGLRNTTALVMAAFYFLAVVLGTRFELSILMRKVLAKVRRFFEVPAFKFYALADGIFRVLFHTGLKPAKKPPGNKTPQMSFSFGS